MIDDLWYKNAIFYCLDVGTFMDANGDGIGDFEGLLRRLDYLAGLGVTALWLQPFQPSPNRDDGYDTSDYYGIHNRHGSLGDFVEFTREARHRGMRVIIDLVINHTSDKHPWFQAARRDENSRFRDFYYWSKTKPRGADKGMVFPGVQTTTWTYDKQAKAFYHHRFYPFQPDLNTQNPAVREEIRKIMGYWLELGVSGFRVDAVPFIIESVPAASKKQAERETKPKMDFSYLRDLHNFLQWRSGDGILLAEANILPKQNLDYFGPEGDRMHIILNFQVNQNLFFALASGDCRTLAKALTNTKERPELAQWGNFLRSHDEADLGRLTDKQRQRVFQEFGPDKDMQLYGRGIRRRLAAMLGGDQRRLELCASLVMSLPGTPVLRYGDEIGMGDDLALEDRKAVRTPMQWTKDPHGGFSRAKKTEIPVITKGAFGCERVNVADQKRNPQSLLNVYERLIRTRKECPEFGWGAYDVLSTGSPHVLAVRCSWRNNAVLSLHNFSAEAQQVVLKVPGGEKLPLTNLLHPVECAPSKDGRHTIDLEPYGYLWYRVGPLLDVATREAR